MSVNGRLTRASSATENENEKKEGERERERGERQRGKYASEEIIT